MSRIFRPFNFDDPADRFKDVALTLAISALLTAMIVISVALWAIFHPPKFHQANHPAYYSAEEYKRLCKKHGNPAVIIEEPGRTPYYYDAQGRKCKVR